LREGKKRSIILKPIVDFCVHLRIRIINIVGGEDVILVSAAHVLIVLQFGEKEKPAPGAGNGGYERSTSYNTSRQPGYVMRKPTRS
jgi:hypothetical protein